MLRAGNLHLDLAPAHLLLVQRDPGGLLEVDPHGPHDAPLEDQRLERGGLGPEDGCVVLVLNLI